jgi:hypothetical protein
MFRPMTGVLFIAGEYREVAKACQAITPFAYKRSSSVSVLNYGVEDLQR